MKKQFFSLYQESCASYISKFRGSGFYTVKSDDGITLVIGRETYLGSTKFKLVPPHTTLYALIAESFHQKYHAFGSPVFIRKQLLDHGFYLPHVVARLKSLEGSCPLCRRRLQKRIHTAMGRIPQDRLEFNFPFKKI